VDVLAKLSARQIAKAAKNPRPTHSKGGTLHTFMGYFASNLAREIARLTGWTDKIWARRYQAM